jgi:hypothetical protein
MNNDFQWFVTFTFDDKKINPKGLTRTDYKELKKNFMKALNNYNRDRNTKLQYVITPELQKENNLYGLHFHALITGLNDLKFVGIDPKTGHKLFRSQYLFERFGANTCIRIFDYNKFVAYYITKYVTKDDERIFVKRYFVSHGLQKSLKLYEGKFIEHLIASYQKDFQNSMVEVYTLSLDEVMNIVNKDKNIKDTLPF